MKISVVTVVLNNVDTIEQTILSVHSQQHGNVEHIIVDGGSTDGTLEIIDRHSEKFSRVLVEPDSGIYDAMNKGISLATGEVVGFLNADDIFENPNILSRVDTTFEDSSIQGCYAQLVYVRADDLDKVVRFWDSREYRPGLFEKGWMPAHPTFYVRREIYQKYGSFKLDYRFHSDYELTARFIAVEQIKTRYVPEVWVRMRVGGATNRSIRNILSGNLESYRACKKLGLNMSPLYFVTKFMMRIPQFFNHPGG
jgi:glycosyltransferase involved in cell wall biosynthesis